MNVADRSRTVCWIMILELYDDKPKEEEEAVTMHVYVRHQMLT